MAHNIDPKNLLPAVHPVLAQKVRVMGSDLERQGILVGVHAGMRTFEEQDKLYAKGRDAQGNVADQSAVVTNAKGGQTVHNYGLAVDIVPYKRNARGILEYTWEPSAGVWDKIGKAGEAQGLSWGGRWTSFKDYPHFEMPDAKWRTLYADYEKGGMQTVWKNLPGTWAVVAGGGALFLLTAGSVVAYFLLRKR